MKANIVSLVLMLSGPLLALSLIVLRRPSLRKIRASFLAGLAIALINFLFEVLGARYDVYYVQGLWPLYNSPLSRTIGWLFLGMTFALFSDLTKAMRHPRLALALLILAGISIGLITDFLGTRWLEFMALGKNGNWLIICLIWASLVPGNIFLYRLLAKKFPSSKN